MGKSERNIDCLTPDERKAFDFLSAFNELEVKPIPEKEFPTADFLVTGDGCGYVVEVKSREDDKEWKRILRAGEVAYKERSLGWSRWAEDVAREALKQIEAVDPDHNRWWILWLSIDCFAAKNTMFEQAISSLFGVRQAVDENSNGWNCLYARPGVFERHEEIVAAVISQGRKLILCVNEFAEDYGSFQPSILFRFFAEKGGLNSANMLEKERKFLAVGDRTIDRSDNHAIEKYIRTKYRFENVMMIDPVDHSGSLRVPRDKSTQD